VVSELKKSLRDATNLNQEVTQIYHKTQVMAQDIQDQIVPQTKALMNLKQHVASLYQQLGNTELKSWYHSLLEAGEFEQLGPIVSSMLAEQIAKSDANQVDDDLEMAEA